MKDLEFVIDFTDITLNETDGVFEQTQEIMRKEIHGGDKLVLRSFVTIRG